MASVRERLSVFAFAAFLVLAIIGVAFAAGYLIGRIFL
jgi:preprotein translocase subunit SecE